jgi:crotonobetainyl-CoA:carnitine CoA-transferase CaiB-like acyl-CoA transferase
MGRIDIIEDPRFRDGWLRTKNYRELEPIMTPIFKSKTTREWLIELEAVGIACSPVNTIAQSAASPQVKARGMIFDVEQPGIGTFKAVNSPFKFSRTTGDIPGHAPSLGEHTEEVLGKWLGMSGEEIGRLKENHVI